MHVKRDELEDNLTLVSSRNFGTLGAGTSLMFYRRMAMLTCPAVQNWNAVDPSLGRQGPGLAGGPDLDGGAAPSANEGQ
jgi:hypothetical protein